MMKKTMLALSIAALATAGAAIAQHEDGHGKDPMGDKTITRAEMQQHSAQMFDRLDANKDGKIDAADRDAQQGAMFDRLDADKDGKLSRQEFAGAHQQGPDGAGERQGRMGMRGDRGGSDGMARMMLRRADANKDWTVTREEFAAAAASHFDEVDANKDGAVSVDERKAAHARMRDMMKARKGQQG
jgi:Ca2+-binding EF-hand superfamily protein